MTPSPFLHSTSAPQSQHYERETEKMSSDETIQERRQRLAQVPRACEACKIRKVRCDRTVPCSNCRTAGITCHNVSASTELSSRPCKVTDLKKELDILRNRVSKIESQLLSQNTPSNHSSNPSDHSSVRDEAQLASTPTAPATVYEGGSSFTNQSLGATQTVQSDYELEDGNGRSGLDESIAHLSNLLQPVNNLSSLDEHQFSPSSSQRLLPRQELLPAALVIAILRQAKARPSVFLSSYVINDHSMIDELCQKVYFPTSPASLGQVTAMNGILAYLLREHVAFHDPLPSGYNLSESVQICDKNFDIGIETYDLLAIPTFENVFALALGVIKAQGKSKPLLSCSLLSAASSHCRMLGYFREHTYNNYSPKAARNMRRVFWTLYVFDKNISLLQGRASYLQDSEIDTVYPEVSNNPQIRAWDESFVMAIKFAKLQGQIYNYCYSRDERGHPSAERMQHMKALEADLDLWYEEFKNIKAGQINNATVFELSRGSWDIMYYSTKTLLLRASPSLGEGSRISLACFQAAKLSLQSHLKCFSAYPNQPNLDISESDYADWVLHQSSFTPFIVVFLYTITTNTTVDVELLGEVVESLRKVRGTSKASEKLYQVCCAFGRLAQGLVESRGPNVGTYNEQDDSLIFYNQPSDIISSGSDYLSSANQDDVMLFQDHEELSRILTDWFAGEPAWTTMPENDNGTGFNQV